MNVRWAAVLLFVLASLSLPLAARAGGEHASALAAVAGAKPKDHDRFPLHVGSAGPNVCKFRYLLRNPAPKQNVFYKHVKGLYKGPMCSKKNPSLGYLGKSFGLVIYSYKYRLGYPDRYNKKSHPVAGKDFLAMLRGRLHPTKEMVALAAKRLALNALEPGETKLGKKIKGIALSQVGVNEQPSGSNRGPRISYAVNNYHGNYGLSYDGVVGQYGVAWCAIFDQWVYYYAGYGTFANKSAGVFYIVDWARHRGLLAAKPYIGSLVAYLNSDGHLGIITKVDQGKGYWTVEGNSSQKVAYHYHAWTDRLRVFINLPGIVPK
jgi:hypothetical protein